MKKLFRFKYEPCSGTCYAPEKKFFDELRALDLKSKNELIAKIVSAHESTCDDPTQLFAVDYDETTKTYIGTALIDGRLDLFSSNSFVDLIEVLTNFVKLQNAGKQRAIGSCVYGVSGIEDLTKIILQQSA